MGLSRRFLNLIVEDRIPVFKSLRCIDLRRQHFFNNTTPQHPNGNGSESEERPQDATSWAPTADACNLKNTQDAAGAAALKIERIRLPNPSFSFLASAVGYEWTTNCFPLADRKVLCTDQSARAFLFDADTRDVSTMPDLHRPKCVPFSLFVPSADLEGRDDGGGSIFVMESIPAPELRRNGRPSHQFEAFVYGKPTLTSSSKSWQCQLLPPPPFVCDPNMYCDGKLPSISSYTVVGGGSHICISSEGTGGTYCLDTVRHTWSHEFKWTLPFHGKVEYVPELNLWFGLSAKDWHLAAADLSSMDSQPQLVGVWKEFNPPEEWRVTQDPQLVNLGSGRFVVVRFFHTWNQTDDFSYEIKEDYFVVLTGVEVVPRGHDGNDNGCDNGDGNGSGHSDSNGNGGNGKVELRMNTHKSKRHTSYGRDGTIRTVF
ncbi:unnamed protein product [Urochloa decumbens]|uniref:Uncharacterized protein n=1 Tax=Urochloa decumbens TaxID=240449 RepID=A0ABC9FXE1_9POAL